MTILEIIVTLAVIVTVLLVAGVPLMNVLLIFGAVLGVLMALAVLLMTGFFAVSLVSLLFCKRVEGSFVRFDEGPHFEQAVYLVAGEEYFCRFPAENVGRRMIYERPLHKLRITRSEKRRTAYDRHSITIITLGSIASALLMSGMLLLAMILFGG